MQYFIHLLFLWSILFFSKASAEWAAFGDLRGQFEPCGCDVRTNYGGVLRLAKAIALKREHSTKELIFDLGNNLSATPTFSLTDRYISKALDEIRPTISLLNRLEIRKFDNTKANRTYLLTNNKKPTEIPTLSVYEDEKTVVLGFVWYEELTAYLHKPDRAYLNRWTSLFKEKKGKTFILLFSGDLKLIEDWPELSQFTTVILSNQKPLEALPDASERENPKSLNVLLKNKRARMVPLAGYGLLLEEKPSAAESVQDIFTKEKSLHQPSMSASLFQEKETGIQWLNEAYHLDSPLQALEQDFNQAKLDEYQKEAQRKASLSIKSKFVGNEACKNCHSQAYRIWSESKHAHAWQTLKDKNKQKDQECVSCHVVGMHEEGGFISSEKTPHLTNVQCENCHGSRQEHIQNPKIKGKNFTLSQCANCHNKTHSPSFTEDEYWKKIKHGL